MALFPEHDASLHPNGTHVLAGAIKGIGGMVNDLNHSTRETRIPL
jgi:hypothetical protein